MELSTTLIIIGVIILLIVGIILFVVLTPSPQQGWATKQTTDLGTETDTKGITVNSVKAFSNKSVYTFGANFFPGPTADKTYTVYDGAQSSNPRRRLEIFNDTEGLTSCLVKYDTDGQMLWVAKINGTWNIAGGNFPEENPGKFVTVDKNENIYIMGTFGSNEAGTTVTFYDAVTDTSQNVSPRWTMTRLANNFYNTFLAKYNKNGILQWTTKIGSTTNGRNVNGYGIECNDTDVFVSGSYRGDVNFYDGTQGDPTDARWTMTKLNPGSASADTFLAKFDFNGSLIWTTKIDGLSTENFPILAVNNTNVYFTGLYSSASINMYNALEGNPTIVMGTMNKTVGVTAIFLVNFNVSGELQWSTKTETDTLIVGPYITLDSYNNIYQTSTTISSATEATFYDVAVGNDSIPATWNPTTQKWTVSIPGIQTGLLAKYNPAGELQWTTKAGFTNNYAVFRGVSTDSDNNVYGILSLDKATLYDAATGDPTVERWTLTNQENASETPNNSLIKYNSEGKVLWSTLLGSVLNNEFLGVSADTNDNIYVTGYYYESVNVYEAGDNGQPSTVPTIVYPNDRGYRQGIVVKYTKDGQIIA